MAIPNKTNLETLDYSFKGQPFCNVPAKDIDLTTLDYYHQAQPFAGNPFSGAEPVDNVIKINIGDVWKTFVAGQLNIGDVWKAVPGKQLNIGDSWKTSF